MKMNTCAASIFALLLVFCSPNSWGSELRNIAIKAYRDFAWIPVFDLTANPGLKVPFETDVATLTKYFTVELSNAIHQDFQCTKQKRQLCKIDFEILFGSQDPSASELTVSERPPDEVRVCFKTMSGTTAKCIDVRGIVEQGKTRIHDLNYLDMKVTLRGILGLPKAKK